MTPEYLKDAIRQRLLIDKDGTLYAIAWAILEALAEEEAKRDEATDEDEARGGLDA
jgi:hypothetical protein